MTLAKTSFPEEDEAHAAALDPNLYPVLRRLPPHKDAAPADHVGLIVDCETSSTDPSTMEPIEVCLQQFAYTADGEIVGAFRPMTWRQEPKRAITPEATAIHGIANGHVMGQRFDLDMIESTAKAAAVVIAHNAAFDRPHFEKVCPAFADRPWICSLEGIDWKARGARRRDLISIVESDGFFYDAHGAVEDCRALLFALSIDDRFAELRRTGRKILHRCYAVDSPFHTKDKLKARGYFWNDGENGQPKAWYRDIAEADVDPEIAWLADAVYPKKVKADLPLQWRVSDAFTRYTSRV